ncbi:MAG: DUF86 domain-containing protein [Candidatus Aminicenantes bacterium]|nr:MAG: DUF86 domain-containing protein [Candidatus Aminicenantes bacterium]
MDINLEKLKKRISEIKEYKEKIKKYSSISDSEFWKDERNILAIKHLLLQSIEACGSICSHVLAKKFFKSPSSFSECFEFLFESKVINRELSVGLRKMARFRNILVHRYWEIEDKKILEYAKNNLGDFDRFLEAVIGYIEKEDQLNNSTGEEE